MVKSNTTLEIVARTKVWEKDNRRHVPKNHSPISQCRNHHYPSLASEGNPQDRCRSASGRLSTLQALSATSRLGTSTPPTYFHILTCRSPTRELPMEKCDLSCLCILISRHALRISNNKDNMLLSSQLEAHISNRAIPWYYQHLLELWKECRFGKSPAAS